MRLPLIFLLLALLAAAAVAYGTDPRWAQFSHGLDIIVGLRRLQGPLEAGSLIGCVAYICIVIARKRRITWLIGLIPVLALFGHRFATDPAHHYSVADNPALVPASSVNFLRESDYVVGLTVKGTDLAFPYSALFSSPAVIEPVHDVRCLVMWSPYANRAMAFIVEHDFRARDLEVVCMPGNALLLYNARTGQFINGLTGQTTTGARPTGLLAQVETQKMPWSRWRSAHADTLVMATPPGRTPAAPLGPRYAMGAPATQPAPRRIIFIATTQPVAVDADAVTDAPAHISGQTNLLIFRDPATGRARVYDRRCNGDLFPVFSRKSDPKRSSVAFIDRDSNSEWTLDCRAIAGPLAKEHLRPIAAEDDLDWGVMKSWYPGVELVHAGSSGK